MRHSRYWLLLVAPLVLAGCGTLGGSATGTGTTETTAETVAEGANSWLVVTRGSPTPTPRPSNGVPAYPVPTATGFIKRPTATASAKPVVTCTPTTVHFSRIGALEAVAGATTATATWNDVNGYNLVEYRLTAISQDPLPGKQREMEWVTIKPKENCGKLSATVTKLDRKTGYILSLDAVVSRKSGDGTHAGTILRSSVIRTE
ncbi:hypothetical protein [Actinoplanes sp. NPDC051859]|uniref:hypothetical protein n=1 Tax=Actinoplanes sp. NPDC051859 TaxID=3363909 RepID=UPI0037AF4A8E